MSPTTEKQALKDAFDESYNNLNDAQKEAVDSIEGPVMVIAGPGTGKTQILTLRIANILLKTDTTPDSILALTFTEAGARAMRQRLRLYLGSRAYQVAIFTFHGFAEKLIRDYPTAFERIIGGRPASELEKIEILQLILDTEGIKHLRPAGDPSYYLSHLKKIINDLKKEFISPDDLVEINNQAEQALLGLEKFHQKGAHKGKVKGDYSRAEKSLTKNRELALVYRTYEAALRAQKLYDFEDMISETVKALTNDEDLLRDLQEHYQYLLADEHQDVNGSQNRILDLLASFHDQPNIFVVGDEKQSIYRFQGASLENFLYFKDKYPGTKVIQLTDNYRSGQLILDTAHSLVAVEDGPLMALRVPLLAKAVKTAVVSRHSFSSRVVEDDWLVSVVKAQLVQGISPSEIAIIVRTNHEVEALTTLLRKANLAVEATADGDVLAHSLTHTIESLIGAVADPTNESYLFKLLHGPYWGLKTEDVIRILRARNRQTPLTKILASEEILMTSGVEMVAEALKISQVLDSARVKSITEPPQRVLEYLVVESGLLNLVNQQNALESKRVLRRLYDEVETLVIKNPQCGLADVLKMFKQTREHKLALSAPYLNTDIEAVQIMTAHKSKGLEFAVVIIPHLQDNNWGGSTKRNYFTINLNRTKLQPEDQLDDEKRLLYVAITRAKTQLFLSEAKTNAEGKGSVPTRLFELMDQTLIQSVDESAFEAEFSPLSVFKLATPKPLVNRSWLKLHLATKGFSATSFNNYVSNPWDYFYLNVLQIPKVQETHLQFGTAIHSVLEFATKSHTETGSLPNILSLKNKLKSALERLPISDHEYNRLFETGMEMLEIYLAHLVKTLPIRTEEEFRVAVVLPTGLPDLPELPLTGNLDRLDFDENNQLLRVVDYKTGKPKSRNEIEGKTAQADGNYKRQLVFYALLLQLYNHEQYQTRDGVLSFVKPTEKGEVREEMFTISETEIQALKEDLISAVSNLLDGDWQNDPNLKSASQYVDLIGQLEDLG